MTVPTDVAIYLLNQKRAELAAMEAEFETEIVIVGDDSLMNIDQYSIQRVSPEQVKTDDVLSAHSPSTDAKKKNAQHVEAKRTTTTAPRRHPKKKQQQKKSIWKKLVG
jgi:ABC-type tungstate transport system permease subunit